MRSFTSLFLVVCMFACSLLADYPQLPYYTDIFSLTSDGALKRFSLPDTTTVKSSVKITGIESSLFLPISLSSSVIPSSSPLPQFFTYFIEGLQKNEVALDIDIRPATGALYAITFNRNTTKARLITVNTTTGYLIHSILFILSFIFFSPFISLYLLLILFVKESTCCGTTGWMHSLFIP